jgi:hypothetical protein
MEPQEGTMAGVPKPTTISTKQARIAELARQMPDRSLHSLSRHIDLDWMREAHRRTRKDGAVGVDGQTAAEFAEHLVKRHEYGTVSAPRSRDHLAGGLGGAQPHHFLSS